MQLCMVDIASCNHCSQLIFHNSRTLRHVCMYVCMHATIVWMCASQNIVVGEETADGRRQTAEGRGRLTLLLASILAPLSRSTFATATWPFIAEQIRAVWPSYQRQTHTVRERPRDDTTHHPQTLMQRDMADMDTQTCNSGLHSALLYVCMHNTHYRWSTSIIVRLWIY